MEPSCPLVKSLAALLGLDVNGSPVELIFLLSILETDLAMNSPVSDQIQAIAEPLLHADVATGAA